MKNNIPKIIASWEDIDKSIKEDESLIGTKATGLLKLPKSWVPPMIIFTRRFYESCRDNGVSKSINLLSIKEKKILENFLLEQQNARIDILVRSSTPRKGDFSFVDNFHTQISKPSLLSIIDSMNQIRSLVPLSPVFFILQPVIQPSLVGHMSNERRVTPRKTRWIAEGITISATIINTFQTPISDDLHATTENELIKQLRAVASKLVLIGQGYFHCEWLWTGKRVWIVQADNCDPTRYPKSANSYLLSKNNTLSSIYNHFSILKLFKDIDDSSWKKIFCPVIFHKLGIPTASIFFLSGITWENSKLEKHSRLLTELKVLSDLPVIIRCDIIDSNDVNNDYLPTSSQLSDPQEMVDYMEKVAQKFHEDGVDESKWAFLLSHTIQLRASAMVHAKPGGQWVQVDALWGFPDGLMCYSHDTYYYLGKGQKIQSRIHYKDLCYLIQKNQSEVIHINPPQDWSPVLNDSEIMTISEWGLRIANHLGHEIQLMVFTRINGNRGPDNCLPWHFTEYELPDQLPYSDFETNYSSLIIIKSWDDLSKMKENYLIQKTQSTKISGILVRPEAECLRNRDFLIEVGKSANDIGLPVLFEGSLLGHAYYAMVNSGAHLVPLSREKAPIEVKHYDKLVRDLIPAIIARAGGVARVRKLPRDEAIILLAQKLIEESFEVWHADGKELAEELADVLEVVDSIIELASISKEKMESIQKKKRDERGGFKTLTFLEETTSRPFALSPLQPWELPLFLEEDLSASKKNVRKTSNISVEMVRFDNPTSEKELIRFSLPLIPLVIRGKKIEQQSVKFSNLEVKVQYEGQKICIVISQTSLKVPPEQLSFKLDS